MNVFVHMRLPKKGASMLCKCEMGMYYTCKSSKKDPRIKTEYGVPMSTSEASL